MRSIKLLILFFGLAAVVPACKKQRTCSCTTESSTATSSFDTVFTSMTKDDAKDKCFEFNDGGDDGTGGIYKTTCELVK